MKNPISMSKIYQTRGVESVSGPIDENGTITLGLIVSKPEPVRLLCVDAPGEWCVIGLIGQREDVYRWNSSGRFQRDGHSRFDLREVSPWDKFKVDEPVIAVIYGNEHRRYFAGVSDDGSPEVFADGTTSWSSQRKTIQCVSVRKPEACEL